MINKIISELKAYIRPELYDPVNAIGCGIAVIGSLILLASLVYDIPSWGNILALILWGIGILILILHTRKQ